MWNKCCNACNRDGQQKCVMKHRLIHLSKAKDNLGNQQVRKVDKRMWLKHVFLHFLFWKVAMFTLGD